MLTKVQLARYDNGLYRNSVDFVTGLPNGESGFSIVDVDGLGPVKSIIAMSNYAAVPGGTVHSTRHDQRNIVIKIELKPDYAKGVTVSDLREMIETYAMTGEQVRLRLFKDGVYSRRIDGWVESVEPVIFSKTPEIQISVICPHPYFRAEAITITADRNDQPQVLDYIGTVPWGLWIDVRPQITTQWIEVTRFAQSSIESTQTLLIDGPFTMDQYIRIRTTPGEREVNIYNASDDTLISRLTGAAKAGSSGWPILIQGENNIQVRGSGAGHVLWDNRDSARYGGF